MARTRWWIVIAGLVASPLAGAAELPPATTRTVAFTRDVLPLLKEHCYRCHSGRDAESGIRLDVRRAILGETDGQVLAASGRSAESRLIHAVARIDDKRAMPPVGEGRSLTADEIGLLRGWIDQGVAWDNAALPPPSARSDHWAFQRIQRPSVPALDHHEWPRGPVDSFICWEHHQRGLTPAPPADSARLIRRLTLTLTGLPPTPDAVAEFIADDGPDSVERLVDRLLASPHYGERWGRHWLDVARWAESEGYESNHPRPYAWKYRDYVVRSLNQDVPYDQFLREQLAGDEMTPVSDDHLIATGFLAAARLSSNEEDKALQRNAVLVDIVNTVGEGILGLTLGCAQCHNHKLDPLTQRDYYRLQALFVRGQPNNLVLQDAEGWRTFEAAKPADYDPAVRLLEVIHDRTRDRLLVERRERLSAAMRNALETPIEQRTPEQLDLARQADLELQVLTSQVERGLEGDDKPLYESLKKRIAAIEKTLPDKPQTWSFYSPASATAHVAILPMKGFYPLPYEPDELKRANAYLLVRGDVHRRGPKVEPGWPEVLGGDERPLREPTRPRSALVDWLMSRDHPLTARVWANRVWHYHFGRGLVATPGDFGLKGAAPSHPGLLDWLACELLEGGWSTKRLQRHIVLSSVFRQSSQPSRAGVERDPDDEYHWRWRPRRLEAEAIRDSLLAAAGSLSHAMGGKSDEEKTSRRRSLYVFQKRDQLPEVQRLFDGASANECCSRRHVSTVSLQPLYLLNNPATVELAKTFAARVADEAGVDLERRVERAFFIALSRPPTATEASAARRFLDEATRGATAPGGDASPAWSPLEQLCHAIVNLNEFLYVP